MSEQLDGRERKVKELSLKYIEAMEAYKSGTEKYREKKAFGIQEGYLLDDKIKLEELEKECVRLDQELASIVKKGDKQNIPEYAKTLNVN